MWKPPINSRVDKKEIIQKIDQIAANLFDISVQMGDEDGLMGGKLGIALFFAYYARFKQKSEYVELANEIISDKLDAINTRAQNNTKQESPFFSNGLSGTCWLLNHLIQKKFIEADANEIFSSADVPLAKNMLHVLNAEDNYDFMQGGIGIAHYLVKRKVKEYKKYHDLFLDALIEKGESDKKGETLKWFSTISRENNSIEKVQNLSLSHGMASIAAYLNGYIGNYGRDALALDTLNKLVNDIVDKQNVAIHKSYFPTWISKDGVERQGRLAWCYGDLGIAYALFSSAAVLEDSNIRDLSMEVLLHTCSRKNPEKEGVVDAGLYRGALGIAHIYNRLYNQTGHPVFQETSRHWFLEGLKYAKYEDGMAGYKYFNGKDGWSNSPGFLEGVAGTGLAYISAVSGISPDWDEGLLLS